MKCRDCQYCDDKVTEKEDGETDVVPYCDFYRQELPSYSYQVKDGCVFFRFSSDAMRKYAE